MWTLAIDTSTKTASVALLQNSEVIIEIFTNLGTNHSTVLMPIVENLCNISGVKVGEMDLYVCTIGPGSFTGIRTGISTVKGFAIATGKPVVGVSTLDALALNLAASRITVCPMLDARKNQVYTALYRMKGNNVSEKILPERATDIKDFLQCVDEEVIFLGDGAEKYEGIIREEFPGKAYFTIGMQNCVRASMAGLLGENKFRNGEGIDPVSLMPRYLRRSEAELKMTESHLDKHEKLTSRVN
jgi:tRNA threonylcarbamoyladenosine biosynthesis protein TsaB